MTGTTSRAVELHKQDRTAIVAELTDAGARFASNGKDCRCPWHDDKNPSAGIFQDDAGAWRFKCFTCGGRALDVFDVTAKRTGQPVADIMRDFIREREGDDARKADAGKAKAAKVYATEADLQRVACYQGPTEPPLTVESVYRYTDPATHRIDLIVFRLRDAAGKKTFRQGSPVPGGWQLKGPNGKWPLYNRQRVTKATRVVYVEGEQCVHALQQILPPGWAATTNPGGAESGKVALTDLSPLAGKTCYLWPDNDPPDPKKGNRRTGIAHMRDVADALARLDPPAVCLWIDCDALGLPDKGDAVDWIEAEKAAGVVDPARLTDAFDLDVLSRATPIRPSGELAKHYADVAAGRLKPLAWPWPVVNRATLALQPGRLTVVCGDPGAGKSWMLTEALWHWITHDVSAACLMLELEATFHAKRLHAVLANTPQLLDPEWVAANGAEALALYERHADDLDRFWRALDTVPTDEQVTTAFVLEWMTRRFDAGCKLLIVDPVSAIPTDKPWLDNIALLQPARRLAEKAGASVVLSTHPDRGGKKLSGSEAMRRFVDTVVWLKRLDRPQTGRVLDGSLTKPVTYNRMLRVTKARLGSGVGVTVAYHFGDGLRFAEVGALVGGDEGDSERQP